MKKLIKKYLFVILSLFLITDVKAKTQVLNINSSGIGETEILAIEAALIQAISKVNGSEIAANTKSSISEISNNSKIKEFNKEYKQKVITNTKGLINSWTINSLDKQKDGVYLAKLNVNVIKFKKSVQTNRFKMVLMPLKISDNIKETRNVKIFKNIFSTKLENFLTSSRRFAILDRKYIDDQSKELDFIANKNYSGVSKDQFSKLGNRLGADYIIVGTINKAFTKVVKEESKVSEKVKTSVNSYASVNIRIIDVATSQIKFSNIFETSARTYIEKLASRMTQKVGVNIVESIYPISIISASSNQVVLGQGGTSINVGDIYKIYQLGNIMIDPHTKESLGREEIEVGAIRILTIRPKFTDARILESIVDLKNAMKENDKFIARFYKKSEIKRSEKSKNNKLKKAKSLKKLKEESSDDW